jgi:hypothetical protein
MNFLREDCLIDLRILCFSTADFGGAEVNIPYAAGEESLGSLALGVDIRLPDGTMCSSFQDNPRDVGSFMEGR